MGFPLMTVPIINAVVFSTNELGKKLFGFHDENEMGLIEGNTKLKYKITKRNGIRGILRICELYCCNTS